MQLCQSAFLLDQLLPFHDVVGFIHLVFNAVFLYFPDNIGQSLVIVLGQRL